ncbi:MAG: hypothetical protein KUG77_28420 [Nannocystaceae bacterium]|nr:hypothetical protein [Nannocystaceae bacterium]
MGVLTVSGDEKVNERRATVVCIHAAGVAKSGERLYALGVEPSDERAVRSAQPDGFSGARIELVELDRDHPGFSDAVYRQRRNAIAALAQDFSEGDPFPDVEYDPVEQGVWRTVWNELAAEHARAGCRRYRQACEAYGFDHTLIPSFAAVNAKLRRGEGFSLLPVAGLVKPRVFLEELGNWRFLATQYMRHHSQPLYTPEPDVVHEYIGHVPWLADPELAELNYAFGLAAQRADAERIEALIRVYWYTIEFGVVREDDELKVYGAGILSSFGELRRFSAAEHRRWDLDAMAAQDFDPTHYQAQLYVAPSYSRMRDDLLRWLRV